MESMNISLPEHLRDFVLKQVESGYGSVSEYIRELIRADENRKRQEALEAKLLEGLASGRGRELTDADWNDLKNVVIARHQTRKDMRQYPMRIIVLPRAEADIVESAQFIAEDSLDAALRFMDQAQVAFNFLRQFPEAGSDHVYSSDTLRGTRSWPIRGFENWIVFYVVRDNELIVIRVLHGARDV